MRLDFSILGGGGQIRIDQLDFLQRIDILYRYTGFVSKMAKINKKRFLYSIPLYGGYNKKVEFISSISFYLFLAIS